MPVPYERIPYEQLLCHQAAYDLIDLAGRNKFRNWDILEFEKAILGAEGTKYICTDEDHQAIVENLKSLNSTMPFLKYGEPGQHYAYELFLSTPDHWSSRGAPFFWAYVARQFTFDKLPMTEDAFKAKYMSIVKMLDVPFGNDEYIYINRFAAGGMSSGLVGGIFAQNALDKLIYRLKKYL
jgi:hypothetical protein